MSSRITDLRLRRRSLALREPFVTALRSATSVESVLVELRTGDGLRGVGEAAPVAAITGESPASVLQVIERELRPVIVGYDSEDVVGLASLLDAALAGHPSAKAALDIALYDLAARRSGVPLALFLGAGVRPVATDVTISAGGPAEMASAAGRRLADGFTCLKLKVGDGRGDDLARILAVAEIAGPQGARLRLDANQGWTARWTISVVEELELRGVPLDLVEQPVPAGDLDGPALVSATLATPVLADEAVHSVADAERLVERQAADLVNIKLMKSGGITNARAIVAALDEAGVGWIVGGMMEPPVAVAGGGALALLGRAGTVHDLDAAWWLAQSRPEEALQYRDGTLLMPSGAGLGLDPA
ncbi:MAG TPA: dipeptide epimerase [Acidimicrobiales bacterium]|nr:dipeptide epimerase [Acidimicrobiales bacterium]